MLIHRKYAIGQIVQRERRVSMIGAFDPGAEQSHMVSFAFGCVLTYAAMQAGDARLRRATGIKFLRNIPTASEATILQRRLRSCETGQMLGNACLEHEGYGVLVMPGRAESS